MQRRHFIFASGGLLGALAAPAASPSTVRLAGFRDLVGQEFLIFQGMRGMAATLSRVSVTRESGPLEQFSLYFSTGRALPAGAYDVENALTGRMSMYLEPVGPGRLRADFSLLV